MTKKGFLISSVTKGNRDREEWLKNIMKDTEEKQSRTTSTKRQKIIVTSGD